MRNLQIKIHFMVVVALSLGVNALAQEISADRLSTSNVQRPNSDVIEIETEIGSPQIKPSEVIDKPKIKPRSDYAEGKPSIKKSSGDRARFDIVANAPMSARQPLGCNVLNV